MNLQFYLEKLHSSNIFKNFKRENPESFLCSGFFVVDKEGKDNKSHFDYFLPKSKEMVSFQLESMQKIPVDIFNERIPEEVSSDIDFEFDKIEDLILKKMEDEKITNKLQKMIFSLQKLDGKDFLVGNIFVSMLGILKINIDLSEMKIVEFEKKSIFDIMNVLKKKND